MRAAHFDVFSGISGDMAVAALIDAGAPWEAVRAAIESTGLGGGLELAAERGQRGHLAGTRFAVADASKEKERSHRGLSEILGMLGAADLSERARRRAEGIFRTLAEAEGRVHGRSPQEVHFHEVGGADSIADIVGVCAALELLEVDLVSSGVPALGHDAVVQCAHGSLPVPAPAVVEILKGRSVRPGLSGVEMTTPTGAAILKSLAGRFGPIPEMELLSVGCGLGTRDDPRLPNLLRVFLGETRSGHETGEVLEVSVTYDDISGEVLGYLMERLPEVGALEVSLLPCTLKKSRAGSRLSVLTPAADLRAVAEEIFKQTSTLGLRFHPVSRMKLERSFETVETRWGAVRVKCGLLSGRLVTASPEYEDCRRLAASAGVPLKEVQAEAVRLFSGRGGG